WTVAARWHPPRDRREKRDPQRVLRREPTRRQAASLARQSARESAGSIRLKRRYGGRFGHAAGLQRPRPLRRSSKRLARGLVKASNVADSPPVSEYRSP